VPYTSNDSSLYMVNPVASGTSALRTECATPLRCWQQRSAGGQPSGSGTWPAIPTPSHPPELTAPARLTPWERVHLLSKKNGLTTIYECGKWRNASVTSCEPAASCCGGQESGADEKPRPINHVDCNFA